MRPDYLAIGVESNVMLSRDSARWQQLKELHRETYSAIKKQHRSLPVFFTTDVLHYKQLTRDAKGSFGPPSFEDARLSIGAGETKSVTIHLNY